jgi:hypothetical protein
MLSRGDLTFKRDHARRTRNGHTWLSTDAVPLRRLLLLAALSIGIVGAFAAPALAASNDATYTATQTVPVPPASDYAGSGGGDGWAVALSNTQVFNVFHHNSQLQVVCHNQSDASTCWGPTVITDASGNGFATGGQPGLYLDQNTGKLYVYATRSSDGTGGVVCIDTTQGASSSDPFCGFTQLTAVGSAPINSGGYSDLSGPMLVGQHFYSFNYVDDQPVNGDENKLLCFDTSTDSACAGQPFTVNFNTTGALDYHDPSPGGTAIGTQLIIPVSSGGSGILGCFDDSAQSNCSGSWPAAAPSGYVGSEGSPFPLPDSSGTINAFCLPDTNDDCYNLDGSTLAPPPGLTAAVGSGSVDWNGPGLTLGPRVYVPAWSNVVYCYDASTQASCANFPKNFNNLDLLYTVNPDPQRPSCIWVNSDNGQSQIQNFDAYTGGACGQGSIRVLAKQFIVAQKACYPDSYQSLQITSPARNSYSSGSVQFDDGDGNPIPGQPDGTLDSTGSVNLQGYNLNTSTGLPQFVITLNGTSGAPQQIDVKLTWTAPYNSQCVGPHTQVSQAATAPSSTPASAHTLTVNVSGPGSVTDGTKAISCKPTCSHAYPAGTAVKLTAKPAVGSKFVGWSGGGCQGTGTCTVVLNADTTVSARFDKGAAPQLRLDSGPGGISINPTQLNCQGELSFIRAVGFCSVGRVHVAGKIAKTAGGVVLVRIYSYFGKRAGEAKISHGHWSVNLDVPGFNADPLAPRYLIVVHYGGGQGIRAGTISRAVRIEVEPKELGEG